MKRLLTLAAGAVLGLAIGAVALLAFPSLGPADPAQAPTPQVPRATVPVTRVTLRSTEDLDATLGYDGEGIIPGWLDGTLTALPEDGDVLAQGDVIAEVDGDRRTVLLYGERPAWRPMAEGVEGADVRQLEVALKTLGFIGASVEPDREFTSTTTDAVKRWQRDLGVDDDGIVQLGEVVFVPDAVRIAQVPVRLGEPVRPGTPIATTTSATRIVTLPLEADRQDIVAPGDAVGITLPDDTETTGTIREIGRVARLDPDGTTRVDVTIDLDDPSVTGTLDGAPVTVTITRETRPDVLTVPVDALLALAEGGYGVELAQADGTTRLIGVETGLFADDRVEVTGDLAEGDEVVVPR